MVTHTTTLFQIAVIGNEMHQAITKSGPGQVFVSGPLTTGGFGKEQNYINYRRAILRLTDAGEKVFDPLPWDDRIVLFPQKYWGQVMSGIFGCILSHPYIESIYRLPLSQTSKGATFENHLALYFNKRVFTFAENS